MTEGCRFVVVLVVEVGRDDVGCRFPFLGILSSELFSTRRHLQVHHDRSQYSTRHKMELF